MNALAADVGGTSIRVALVDASGGILERDEAATPQDPREGVARIASLWRRWDAAAPRGLVIAGAIRPGTGEITQSPNLRPWEGTCPGAELGCVVHNDANGALLGECWTGALQGCRSALMLTLGTGVGGGLLMGGTLWEGATGCAGEAGHLSVHPDGPPCGCGSRGCLELYASANAVAKAAGTRDAKEASDLARLGEPRSRGAFERAAEALGIALAGLANVLNPEVFCLGGGLSNSFDLLRPTLLRTLRERAFHLATESLRVLPARLGGDAGLVGAAWAAAHA